MMTRDRFPRVFLYATHEGKTNNPRFPILIQMIPNRHYRRCPHKTWFFIPRHSLNGRYKMTWKTNAEEISRIISIRDKILDVDKKISVREETENRENVTASNPMLKDLYQRWKHSLKKVSSWKDMEMKD